MIRILSLLVFLSFLMVGEHSDQAIWERSVKVTEPFIPETLTFAGEPVPLHRWDVYERLDKMLTVQVYDQATTLLVFKRAKRWEPRIKQILKEEGIPEDFFYVMLAESGARNVFSVKGAGGFWQFVPEAAMEYGLIVNSYIDERLDPEKATRAACKYLKNAKHRLGSWTNAAAGYNLGIYGLEKQMREQKEANFYNLHLNSETALYLFRVLAYKLIWENPKRYGYPDSLTFYSFPPYIVLKVTEPIPDLVDFAHQHSTSYAYLRYLNPWIVEKSLPKPPRGYYEIKLPIE
jgi:hypothetical protein